MGTENHHKVEVYTPREGENASVNNPSQAQPDAAEQVQLSFFDAVTPAQMNTQQNGSNDEARQDVLDPRTSQGAEEQVSHVEAGATADAEIANGTEEDGARDACRDHRRARTSWPAHARGT